MIVSWALAVVLALAPHPLYGFYAHLASRPGGISAMADQQIAAGSHVGAGLDHVRDRDLRLRPPLADAAAPEPAGAAAAGGRALGGFNAEIAIPIAAHFLTGSVLTLVLPLGVLIVVAIWYVVLWRRGTGER